MRNCIKGHSLSWLRTTAMVRNSRIPNQGRNFLGTLGSSPSDAESQLLLALQGSCSVSFWKELAASGLTAFVLNAQKTTARLHIPAYSQAVSPGLAQLCLDHMLFFKICLRPEQWIWWACRGPEQWIWWVGQGRGSLLGWRKSNYLRSIGIKMEKEILKINLKIITNTSQRKQ